MNEKTILNYLEVSLAEHCNLNCRGCSHFSPLAKKEFLQTDQLKKDLTRISDLFGGRLGLLRLMGGEPLLHPQITELLEISRNSFPQTHIQLVTNGLLLPKQTDLFFDCCRTNQIDIHITVYPINGGYEKVWKLLDEKQASFSVSSNTKNSKKTFHHLVIDPAGGHDGLTNYLKLCTCSKCTNLLDGKLYLCPVRASIRHFNTFFQIQIPLSEDDYIDIHDESMTAEKLLRFISAPTPFCSYCNCSQIRYGEEWGISQKSIFEWT